MSEQTGFVLPRAAINRAYVRFVPWVVLGLAVSPLLGLTRSIAATLESAVLVAVILGIGYWLTKRYRWVYLSATGIQGTSGRGIKVLIPWSEQVMLKRSSYGGIAGVSVQPVGKSGAIFLPLPIAASAEFRSKLEQLAPVNHPLRSVSNRETAP